MTPLWPHLTVLKDEVVAHLAPHADEVFVDGTLGMGGHTEALLMAGAGRVIGIDRDPEALAIAARRLKPFGDRVTLVQGELGDLAAHLDGLGLAQVDGVMADLGVSSLQLDEADRGFSFRQAGPVDMRMDPTSGQSAAELLDDLDEAGLVKILKDYGEERYARRVARAMLAGRPWSDTAALAEAIRTVVPPKFPERIHPATRAFQALRIAVNDELGEVGRFLPAAVGCLGAGGRLAVIAFHSLEDRLVKRFLAFESGRTSPRDAYGHPASPPRLRPLPKLVRPAADDPNPRARSARLRCAVRS